MKNLIVILTVLISLGVNAQDLNSNWKNEMNDKLQQFMQCKEPADDRTACNRFVGEALKTVYKIDDFYSEETSEYLSANEIYNFLRNSDKWTLLGKASDQNTLNNAQGYANLKKAVVAVKQGSDHGHVALVLPYELQNSGYWQLKVPNSASFRLDNVSKSYVGQGLSYAFSTADKDEVLIYGRNY